MDFTQNHWYVITYCARKNVWNEWMPAEWFILNAPYASQKEAETIQAQIVHESKGTDADWPEAYAAAKIVHRSELAEYGLQPLDESLKQMMSRNPLESVYAAPEDIGMDEEAREQWRYEHGI